MHIPTGVVGSVKEIYDGVEKKFVDPNGVELKERIVALEPGHAFLSPDPLDESQIFHVLSEGEREVYVTTERALGTVIRGIAAMAQQKQLEQRTVWLIVAGTIRGLERTLMQGMK